MLLPLMPGVPERRTHDYVRHGTTNLYAALDAASGQVISEMTPQHRAEEFRRFLNLIDKTVPADLDVHVVLDNSSTHKTPSIQRCVPSSSIGGSRPNACGAGAVSTAAATARPGEPTSSRCPMAP